MSTYEFAPLTVNLAARLIEAFENLPVDADHGYYANVRAEIKCHDETVGIVRFSEVGDWYVLVAPGEDGNE